jgi:hypothetical protein
MMFLTTKSGAVFSEYSMAAERGYRNPHLSVSLERKLSALIDRTDSVRFYRLPVNARISVYGDTTNEVFSSSSYVVI